MLTEGEFQHTPAVKLRCAIVLMVGPPGVGKTTFARALRARTGIEILESDAVRRSLFPRPTYGRTESRAVFDAIHASADERLAEGAAVVIDATNLVEAERAVVYRMADRHGASCVVVRVTARPAVVRERLVQRSARSPSEAGVEVYERMRRIRQPLRRPHFIVDSSADTEPAIEAIAREIEAR